MLVGSRWYPHPPHYGVGNQEVGAHRLFRSEARPIPTLGAPTARALCPNASPDHSHAPRRGSQLAPTSIRVEPLSAIVEGSGKGVVAHVGLQPLDPSPIASGSMIHCRRASPVAGERLPLHDRDKVLVQAMLMLPGGGADTERAGPSPHTRPPMRRARPRPWPTSSSA
jgi:hypothetical protein